MLAKKTSLLTPNFVLLCLSHLLFAASFTMILPELPAHLSSMGGDEWKGWIIALFTLTAGISRPFSGKLTDTLGRVPVMIVGTLVCVVCSLLYPLMTTVFGFLVLRFFHGFSTGFKPTASTAYAADILPMDRRGEGLGILGMSMNFGASLSPLVGSWVANVWGLNPMFMVSSGFALVSVMLLWRLPETLEERQSFRWSLLRIGRHEIIEPSAIAPAIVTAFAYVGYGVILTIVPDQSEALGMTNKGIFYGVFTAASLLSRVGAGKISDRLGRVVVLRWSMFLMVCSMIAMGFADTVWMFLLAGSFLGFSTGMAAPAIFAWTADRSPRERWGRANGTVYIALEVGIGFGALLSAYLYQSNPSNFAFTFWVFAGITLLGWLYIYRVKK